MNKKLKNERNNFFLFKKKKIPGVQGPQPISDSLVDPSITQFDKFLRLRCIYLPLRPHSNVSSSFLEFRLKIEFVGRLNIVILS